MDGLNVDELVAIQPGFELLSCVTVDCHILLLCFCAVLQVEDLVASMNLV